MCANDPNDQMIAEASSLKEGVTNEIMKRAVDNQYTWATDTTRTLPLWLEVDEGDEEDEEDEGREHLDPATVLVGTFNALKSLLQASAVRDQALIGQVLRDVYNCDGRQNKTLGKCAFSTSVHLKFWVLTFFFFNFYLDISIYNMAHGIFFHCINKAKLWKSPRETRTFPLPKCCNVGQRRCWSGVRWR